MSSSSSSSELSIHDIHAEFDRLIEAGKAPPATCTHRTCKESARGNGCARGHYVITRMAEEEEKKKKKHPKPTVLQQSTLDTYFGTAQELAWKIVNHPGYTPSEDAKRKAEVEAMIEEQKQIYNDAVTIRYGHLGGKAEVPGDTHAWARACDPKIRKPDIDFDRVNIYKPLEIPLKEEFKATGAQTDREYCNAVAEYFNNKRKRER